MCDYSQQTYQATSLTCGAGGAQLMFLGAQLHHTYHCIVYNNTLQRTNLGKLPKNHIFSEATPPYDILLLHIIVCSANIRYNSLFHLLRTVTNTPLYNALLQRKSKSVTPTLSDSVWIVVFVLPLSTINMHHSPRLCS